MEDWKNTKWQEKLTLETQRLILRPFTIEDAEAMFFGWESDDEVTKYLTWNTHKNLEETKLILNQWIKEYEKPERLNFAIVLKEQGKVIGGIDVVGYLKYRGIFLLEAKFLKGTTKVSKDEARIACIEWCDRFGIKQYRCNDLKAKETACFSF